MRKPLKTGDRLTLTLPKRCVGGREKNRVLQTLVKLGEAMIFYRADSGNLIDLKPHVSSPRAEKPREGARFGCVLEY
jgi:hypothetical protein